MTFENQQDEQSSQKGQNPEDTQNGHTTSEGEQQSKGTYLVKRTPIDGTPFVIITTDEGSFLTMGNRRLSEPKTSEPEVYAMLQGDNKWNVIFNMIMAVPEIVMEHMEAEKRKQEEIEEVKKGNLPPGFKNE